MLFFCFVFLVALDRVTLDKTAKNNNIAPI